MFPMNALRRLKRWIVDTVIGVEFRTIPWEQLEAADLRDCTVWKDRALKVTTMIRQMNYSEYEKTFHKRQLAMLFFDSIVIDGRHDID